MEISGLFLIFDYTKLLNKKVMERIDLTAEPMVIVEQLQKLLGTNGLGKTFKGKGVEPTEYLISVGGYYCGERGTNIPKIDIKISNF